MKLRRGGDDRVWERRDRDRSAGSGGTGALFWAPEAGPLQIPLGGGWFLAIVLSMWFGVWPLAVILAATGALAAGQTARAWSGSGEQADVSLALLVAGLAPLAAVIHTAAFGAVLCAGVAVSVLGASAQAGTGAPGLRAAGFTIQAWLPVALATGSVVLVHEVEPGAAVWIIMLTAIYDAGHYLVSADADHGAFGVLAGMVGVGVASFSLVMIGVPPLDTTSALRFGAAAAVLAPLGVFAAGVVLPDPDADAGALRRLDSLLLASPVWALAIGRHIQGLS